MKNIIIVVLGLACIVLGTNTSVVAQKKPVRQAFESYREFTKVIADSLSDDEDNRLILKTIPSTGYGIGSSFGGTNTVYKFAELKNRNLCQTVQCNTGKPTDGFNMGVDWFATDDFLGLDLDSEGTKNLIINALFPSILRVLGFEAGYIKNRTDLVKVSTSQIGYRLANQAELRDYYSKLVEHNLDPTKRLLLTPTQRSIAFNYNTCRLHVTVRDLVIRDLSFDVDTSSNKDVKLGVSLKGSLIQSGGIIGDSEFKYQVKENGTNKYNIKVSSLLVLGLLTQNTVNWSDGEGPIQWQTCKSKGMQNK